jgi:hypothetical protein
MLKLLLREDRYNLKKEFLFRFLNILLIFVIIGIIITGVLLTAPYVLVKLQKNVVEDQLTTLQNSDNSIQKTELRNITRDLRNEFEIFKQPTAKYSNFINEILLEKPEDIRIRTFNLEQSVERIEGEDKSVIRIELRGQADSRTSLVNYSDSLKANTNFYWVNLPLSNLVKDSNVIFNMTLITSDFEFIN